MKKIAVYSFIGFSLLTCSLYGYTVGTAKSNFLETSFVSVLNSVADDVVTTPMLEPVDLGITNVTLRKVANPSDDFNYYKYEANVSIKNYGGDLKNGQLVLQAGDGQKHLFVRNDADGFSLLKGQSHVIENYEVLFDGNYNAGSITFEIKLPEKVDYYGGNNKYTVSLFNDGSKIDGLEIGTINEDNSVGLNFKPSNSLLSLNGFEVYESDDIPFDKNEEQYSEVNASDQPYGYSKIKNSLESIQTGKWSLLQDTDADAHLLKFSKNLFEDKATHFIYLKSTDKDSGNYAFSDIIKLSPQKELTRSYFAKYFVDYTGITLADKWENIFTDVKSDDWYALDVQTLYDLGLIKNNQKDYNPDLSMTRGDTLKVVSNYFGVKLNSNDWETINPKFPATKMYLKQLINEYKKNT